MQAGRGVAEPPAWIDCLAESTAAHPFLEGQAPVSQALGAGRAAPAASIVRADAVPHRAKEKRAHRAWGDMLERGLNAFWILLGAAAAAASWSLGIVGSAGPESGFFPLIAALIVLGAGVLLFVRKDTRAHAVDLPRGAALGRILGVVAGLALMALAMPFLGFAVTGTLTMIVLLRTVEQTSWPGSIALAVASSAAVVSLFGHVLGMALPRGPWGW